MDFKRLNEINLKQRKKIAIAVACFFIGFFGIIITIMLELMFMMSVSIISVVIGIIMICSNKHDIRKELLHRYILPILNDSFQHFKYDDNVGLDKELVRYLDFISIGDSISCTYSMEGYYRNTSFLEGGVRCVKYEKDDDGDVKTTTTFSGRIIVLGLSLFKGEGFVDIVGNYSLGYGWVSKTKRATLNHEIEKYYNIYVSNPNISLSEKIMNYFVDLAKKYSRYDFCFRITNDKLYIVVNDIGSSKFGLSDLNIINKENVDYMIKSECTFITNTISVILD